MAVVDPAPLSPAQRAGHACAVCEKRWPRPTERIGDLPDGAPVLACVECAGPSSQPSCQPSS
ncbi:hypothetical protein [Actinomadura miaoliensis]|uniref:hypothetical protein n=1 Tax=Actinomadura miaoliensis TaxID=430685 RepID=UPI0031E5B0D2